MQPSEGRDTGGPGEVSWRGWACVGGVGDALHPREDGSLEAGLRVPADHGKNLSVESKLAAVGSEAGKGRPQCFIS